MENSQSPYSSYAHASGMPIVTVIGDGQLARMMQSEAVELGLSLRILAGDLAASASQVAADIYQGDYTSLEDIRAAAEDAAVVTFEHEHVPNDHLDVLIAEGVNVQPAPDALIYAQDKLSMRNKMSELGLPIPAYRAINSLKDAQDFWDEVEGAVCLKARRGGYDGHGVWFPENKAELESLVSELLDNDTPLMAEEKVNLSRELSALVARTPSGEVKTWPVAQSVQTNGICTETVAPAPQLSEELHAEIAQLAETVATELQVTGVLAVELFETRTAAGEPQIFINELAMRPHNTGHWTQDGCVTSQFEQHLRAVLDWPLGATTILSPVTVMANILGADEEPEMPVVERMKVVWRKFPAAKIHLYGKTYRPGRKLGHVNLTGTDSEKTRRDARAAAFFMEHAVWPDAE